MQQPRSENRSGHMEPFLSPNGLGGRECWGLGWCSADAWGRRSPSAQAVGRARLTTQGPVPPFAAGSEGRCVCYRESPPLRPCAANSDDSADVRDWEGRGSVTCLFAVKKNFT